MSKENFSVTKDDDGKVTNVDYEITYGQGQVDHVHLNGDAAVDAAK